MGIIAIFLVCSVICAAWLMVKSQEHYDQNKEGEDDDDSYSGKWGI